MLPKPLNIVQELLISDQLEDIHKYLNVIALSKKTSKKRKQKAAERLYELNPSKSTALVNELLYLLFFSLPEMKSSSNKDLWGKTAAMADELMLLATGKSALQLEPMDGILSSYLGVLFCYGGNDFCIEQSCSNYFDDLAKSIDKTNGIDIIQLMELLMKSRIRYDLLTFSVSLKKLGKTYFRNNAPQQRALAFIIKENERKSIVLQNTYVGKIPDFWSELNPIHTLDLSNATFDENPDNFGIFLQLKTLVLHCLRTTESYNTGDGNEPRSSYLTWKAIPPSIAGLNQLRRLDLSRTMLGTLDEPTVLPDWLGALKKLKRIALPFCHLVKEPLQLKHLPSLKEIEIPIIYSEENDIRAWGIRVYKNGKSTGLGVNWFTEHFPNCRITVKMEEVEEYELDIDEGDLNKGG